MVEIKIRDITGRTIMHNWTCMAQLSVEELPVGIYYVEVMQEGKSSFAKLVKQ